MYNPLNGDFLVQTSTPTISNSYVITRENEREIIARDS
jgi:hypothetical protein